MLFSSKTEKDQVASSSSPPAISSSQQMQKIMLKAGGGSEFLACSHLFLSSDAGLYRNKYWPEIMDSDILIFDFQDGCPPGKRHNVFTGLEKGHFVFPNKPFSVRLTELERKDEVEDNDSNGRGNAIYNEIKACIAQKQVRWLMLPMCNDEHDVQAYIDIINSIDPSWLKTHGALQMLVETPFGLHNLDKILQCHPVIQGVIVGAGDYFRFVHGSKEACLPMLRWDVLNTCLRHGQFPIDAPSFGIQMNDSLSKYIQGVKDAGFRSALILHPAQSKIATELLTDIDKGVDYHCTKALLWNNGRQTGYMHGSGDDFTGPPHSKQSVWMSRYAANSASKRTFLLKDLDPKDLARTRQFLEDLVKEQDKADPSNYGIRINPSNGARIREKWMTVIFLAMVTTCHARHKDIYCNLGFTNARFHCTSDDAFSVIPNICISDAKYVSASLVSRRVTSSPNGDRVIAGYDGEILDKNHQPLFSVRMFLMEKLLPFETFVDGLDFKASDAELLKCVDIGEAKKIAMKANNRDDNDQEEKKEGFMSPGLKLQLDYCNYLGLEAPLHHTTNIPPTVPSTLHLSCHRLPWHGVTVIRDVCYHSPMKPEHNYTRSVIKLEDGAYLSLVKDAEDETLLTSVIYEYDEALYEHQIAKDVGDKLELQSGMESDEFVENPALHDDKAKSSLFLCCFQGKERKQEMRIDDVAKIPSKSVKETKHSSLSSGDAYEC